jgi:membrane protein YdbS with pleckstrin-like domain
MPEEQEIAYPEELYRYLVHDEHVVVIQREHWAAYAPVLIAGAGAWVFFLFLLAVVPPGASLFLQVALIGALAVTGWAAWRLWQWHEDLFIATNKRLVKTYGIVTRKVEMMPLAKVTDMSYHRSPTAKLFGYGTFRLESAGQDQALSTVNFIRQPDLTYTKITAEIFAPPARRATDVRPPPGSGSQLPVVEPDDVWWRKL